MTEPRAHTIVGLTPLIAATFVIGVSLCVLVGWCVDSPALESAWLGLPTMKVNTALALLLGGHLAAGDAMAGPEFDPPVGYAPPG